MGVSRFLKSKNLISRLSACSPQTDRRFRVSDVTTAYLPDIYQADRVDRVMDSQSESEAMMRRLAQEEGIFAGSLGAYSIDANQ